MTFKGELGSKRSIQVIFALIVVFWSTSWIMIKIQTQNIDQGFAISYRFFGASLLLFLSAKIFKFRLDFDRKQHRLMFLQGINLFFFNHLFFYSAVKFLSSGIVGTSAALSVIAIPLVDYLIHKTKFSTKIFLSGIIGIIGVVMIASSELNSNISHGDLVKGLILCLCGVLSFSFGSVIGKELKMDNIKTLISSNAYSMLYGSLVSFLVSFAINGQVSFDFSLPFISSLIYLILFPGIFGYTAILYLVNKIGSQKAAYTALIYPVLALIISGLFEGYQFTIFTFTGIFLVISANIIALRSSKIKEKLPKNVV